MSGTGVIIEVLCVNYPLPQRLSDADVHLIRA